jgi:DNA-directed RNA polymerase subunit F
VAYVEKTEKISPEDREQVRSELVSLAEWLRNRYAMPVWEINRFLHEMLDVSV